MVIYSDISPPQEARPTHKAKEPKDFTHGMAHQIRTALIFFAALLFWELMLHIVIGAGSISGYPILFLLSLSLLCTLFTGWFGKGLNHAAALVIMTLLLIYYGAQLVYYRIFGSVFSISMIGMGGDAVANFGWALRHSILESIWWILLFCLPVLLYIAWLAVRKPAFLPCRVIVHGAVAALVILIWILAAAALRLGGTERHTAYDAYHNSHTDTDTASAKLGALPTTVIELGGSLFGRSGGSSDILTPQQEPMPQVFGTAGDTAPEDTAPDPSAEATGEEPPPLDTSPNVISAIDFEALAGMTEDEDIRALCQYFASVEGTNRNEYTGMFEGYNLIYICAESFSSASVHPEITPTLYKLATGGIVLNNYYNSFMNTTTNGEFAFMTGLWPDVSRDAAKGSYSGSFSQSADRFMPYGLGNVFESIGVNSYAYHNYYGEYYNRRATHSNLGYDCQFMDDGMSFTSYWPASDLEMMQQSVDDYINEDRFNVYYMTFSGHGPYSSENYISEQNMDDLLQLIDADRYGYTAQHYLANALELEYAMQYLMQRLEETGKADNTVIVLTGDHYPYYLSESAYDSIMEQDTEPVFGYYESTCIMWCGAIEEPIVCDTYCCNVDILPTILNLFGIEYDSRLLAGQDIFSDAAHAAVLYNKSYLTEYVTYEAPYRYPLWQVDTSGMEDSELEAYLDYMTGLIDARYAASLKIIETDFYRFVWENSGLMPEGYSPSAEDD